MEESKKRKKEKDDDAEKIKNPEDQLGNVMKTSRCDQAKTVERGYLQGLFIAAVYF